MTIIKKIRLLAAPTPAFVGTAFKIETDAENPGAGIYSATLAEGHGSGTVDWGDGTVEEIGGFTCLGHAYATPGVRTVRLSDDFATLHYSSSDIMWPSSEPHNLQLRTFTSSARNLKKLDVSAFKSCVNLKTIDIAGSRIETIEKNGFWLCTGLSGELWLPSVRSFGAGTGTMPPFNGCTGGITKIHFAAEHETAIRTTASFKRDPTLGTGTAEVVFDA